MLILDRPDWKLFTVKERKEGRKKAREDSNPQPPDHETCFSHCPWSKFKNRFIWCRSMQVCKTEKSFGVNFFRAADALTSRFVSGSGSGCGCKASKSLSFFILKFSEESWKAGSRTKAFYYRLVFRSWNLCCREWMNEWMAWIGNNNGNVLKTGKNHLKRALSCHPYKTVENSKATF